MIKIGSPLSGWAMSLDKVPDPVFSERMARPVGRPSIDLAADEERATGHGGES